MASLEDTFNGVTNGWSTYRIVHRRLGFLWAPATIQHALQTLAKAGLIERRSVPAHPFPTSVYRRLQPNIASPPIAPLTEQQLLSAIKELSRRKPCPAPTEVSHAAAG